jgi:hypothetical protein
MTIMEFVKTYGVEPSHRCERDIVSMVYLGCIFVHDETESSNEFGVAVFPPPGQHFPDDAILVKAVSAGLKLHGVRDGAFVYGFDPANKEQARTAIEMAGLDRCSSPDMDLLGISGCQD